ncbi:uncharacterized protein EI90DRAFT_3020941 [Cantharellus anzutake]|uniref:uncharacterized protein n=1 Tax=Cantharellus anzutake TaxID=1750568 RepID=UPI001902F1A2|nr:uncharacterized protein EI90DRAFT_3020941 [Cantharellus anzutake]KAF8318831.1 hypothetical protein EI90DRAFT_3020941 [Cantharellus anzutake]
MLAWIAVHVPCHAKGNAWTSRTAPSLFRRMCSDPKELDWTAEHPPSSWHNHFKKHFDQLNPRVDKLVMLMGEETAPIIAAEEMVLKRKYQKEKQPQSHRLSPPNKQRKLNHGQAGSSKGKHALYGGEGRSGPSLYGPLGEDDNNESDGGDNSDEYFSPSGDDSDGSSIPEDEPEQGSPQRNHPMDLNQRLMATISCPWVHPLRVLPSDSKGLTSVGVRDGSRKAEVVA